MNLLSFFTRNRNTSADQAKEAPFHRLAHERTDRGVRLTERQARAHEVLREVGGREQR